METTSEDKKEGLIANYNENTVVALIRGIAVVTCIKIWTHHHILNQSWNISGHYVFWFRSRTTTFRDLWKIKLYYQNKEIGREKRWRYSWAGKKIWMFRVKTIAEEKSWWKIKFETHTHTHTQKFLKSATLSTDAGNASSISSVKLLIKIHKRSMDNNTGQKCVEVM